MHWPTKAVTVVFDKPLVPGVSVPANWTGNATPPLGPTQLFTVAAPAQVLHYSVRFLAVMGGIGGLIDNVDYLATPPDVISQTGQPAVAFSNFPLTVLY